MNCGELSNTGNKSTGCFQNAGHQQVAMGIFMGKTHFEERLKVKAWALSCHSLSTQWKVMSWSWVWGLSITLVHAIVNAFLSDLPWTPEVLLGFPMQIYSLFLFTFWVFLKGIWFLSYACPFRSTEMTMWVFILSFYV